MLLVTAHRVTDFVMAPRAKAPRVMDFVMALRAIETPKVVAVLAGLKARAAPAVAAGSAGSALVVAARRLVSLMALRSLKAVVIVPRPA